MGMTVVKQRKPIPPFEKGGPGGILTLNPPHSPFFKGGGFARGVVACGNNGGEVQQIHSPLKKEGASSYATVSVSRCRLAGGCEERRRGSTGGRR